MDIREVLGTRRPIIGMVHLPPLPGAPRDGGDRRSLRERARSDARALAAGGVDAVIVENFGDAPFHPNRVPPITVAAMTDLTRSVKAAIDLPVGVNVLRNDAEAALSIAAATGARFVRVNIHTGARVTDQGVIEGRAHETMRLREELDADVKVLADLDVDLAVVSNNQHATVESVVRHYDIERHFDAWLGLPPTLQGVRRRKPAPWYLEVAHEAVNGGTSLYVGDRESDVQAATHAGMDSALISRTGNSSDSDVDPTHHITSLADLPALVENPDGDMEHDSEGAPPIGEGG